MNVPQRLVLPVFILSLGLFPWLIIGPFGSYFENQFLRSVVFLLLTLFGGLLLRQRFPRREFYLIILFSMLAFAAVYKVAAFLPEISTYPLSLAWSEASRYYYASLYFSEPIYGTWVSPSVLHPTRYLMQSLAFLIPGAQIWVHRLWQVLLWLVTAFITAFVLTWRLKDNLTDNQDQEILRFRVGEIAFILWVFLFLFQGPVYYHLLVMVILVVRLFQPQRLWRSFWVILICSIWAGISRINWFPVPGMLAALLYFLETPVGDKSLWRYLIPPALWTVIGSSIAFGAQQAYVIWSGNPSEQFSSSLTSDLLLYRLLPNQTYPLGILPAILLVSLPLALVIGLQIIRNRYSYHWIRLAGIVGILSVLFSGGVIVSLKIGGGSNLHNLDAYLSLLIVAGGYFYFNKPQPEGNHVSLPASTPRLVIASAVIIPLWFTITAGGQMPVRDFIAAQSAVEAIKSSAIQASQQGGEVLFISQRHLLTFKDIQNVPLVSDYEKVFLMEMAMAGNQPYLEGFYQDLRSQRFALIITDPLNTNYQGRGHSFGEENDAWVARVSEPILCYYEATITLSDVEVQILQPRQTPCN